MNSSASGCWAQIEDLQRELQSLEHRTEGREALGAGAVVTSSSRVRNALGRNAKGLGPSLRFLNEWGVIVG